MNGPRAFLALLALCAAPRPDSAAPIDLSVGGSLEAGYSLALGSGEDYSRFSAVPLAAATGPSWEIRLSASLGGTTSPAEASLLLEEAKARLWLGDYLTLEAGYGREGGIAAEAFPLTAFLGPFDPLSRLEGGGSVARRPEARVSIQAAASWWRLSFACAPFEPELILPALDSPWFPESLVPTSVTIGADAYSRRSLAYQEGAGPSSPFVLEPSYLSRAGASLGPIELDLEYFHGLERQALLTGIVSQSEVSYSFDAVLQPHRSIVDALALAATAVAGPWRIWGEGAYTRGASLASGSVEWAVGSTSPIYFYPDVPFSQDPFAGALPPCVQRDRIAATLGSSWKPDLGELGLSAFAEATWCDYIDSPPRAQLPTLSRAAAASVSLSRLAGRFGLSASGLISLADWSAAIRPEASADLGGDRKLSISATFFVGGSASELGAYAKKLYAAIAFSQAF